MSFLGKVLIVVQLLLSVLFMCAAGAVFVRHTNWRDKHNQLQSAMQTAETDHANQVAELNKQIDLRTQERDAEKNRADAEVGERQRLEGQVATLTQQTNTLNQQLQRQTGVAETKSNEAEFRQAEAEKQRVQNETLHTALEDQLKVNVQLNDDLHNQGLELEELVAQHDALLEQVAFLEKVVRQHNLETDPRAVADLSEPPPAVEGIVVDTRKDKTNRTKFAHISIGEDDGIRVGHVLDVYRSAEYNNGQAQYLGKIRIVYVTSDEAVGMVIEAAKNGIIEKGDNVTTKL
jgi:hypothetical protein